MAERATVAIIVVGVLLGGCATRTANPTATPGTATQAAIASTAASLAPTEVPTAAPTDIPTSTPTATPTPEPTNTPTPVPTYTLSGVVFFDYNANGMRDDGEPPIEGVPVRVAGLSTVSGPDGSYSLAGVPAGEQALYVTADSTFKYLSPDILTEIPSSRGMNIRVDAHKTVSIPLVEGPYRSPWHNVSELRIVNWVDLDTRSCLGVFPDRQCEYVVDWLGGRNAYDGHNGFDAEFGYASDIQTYPMRAGIVFMLRQNGPEDHEILIRDSVPYGRGGDSYQLLVHVGQVHVIEGQEVNPGTLLATGVASTGSIHIGHYTDVTVGHPLAGDFRIPPHADRVKSPFADRMWTSLAAFGRISEVLDDGSERQIYP